MNHMKNGLTLISDDLYLDLRDLVEASRTADPDRWSLRFQRGDWSNTVQVSTKFKDETLRKLDDAVVQVSVTTPST